MTGWKRAWQGSGRGRRRFRPEARPLAGILAAALAVFGLGPASGPVPARAATGCGAGATGAVKTVEGLPRDSGEASGLATSTGQPGVAWMVRDSGHPASLYALRIGPDGTASAREIPVIGAENHDWEDVTYFTGPDGSGRLWVVESGQGGGNRFIYDIPEPDAGTATSVRPLSRYTYAYPDRNTNTESAFTWNGRLVLVTKSFPARVYRFDAPLDAGRLNRPVFLGELTDSNGVSVVKPSPDGRWIATSTHDTVYFYRNAKDPGALEGFLNTEPFHVLVAAPDDNVESGDFYPAGSCQLLLCSEQRNTYRLTSQ
jgi:hypothetical protein